MNGPSSDVCTPAFGGHVSLEHPDALHAGVDHRAILWCRQVVDGLAEGLVHPVS